MIQNPTEYRITQEAAGKLRKALDVTHWDPKLMSFPLYQAMIAGLKSQLKELEEQLSVYRYHYMLGDVE